MRVAFQGERGAYSEEALLANWGRDAEAIGFPTLDDAVVALLRGDVDAALLPAENSIAGTVGRTYELLVEHALWILADCVHPIRHNLLALPGTQLSQIRRVFSHPQALEQCRRFLAAHALEPVPQLDTAGSARLIAEEKLHDTGAIASQRAAILYGLEVLVWDIQDLLGNATRFFLVGKEPRPVARGPAKVSLVFSVPDVPGALYRALGVFAARSLNLSKVESRPDRQRHWRYVFYLDYDAPDAEEVGEVLKELRSHTEFLRLLGIYQTLRTGDGESRAAP
ncbi:MAG: prephenate dehydratase [candidate division KSB1 bacterium]|nr:prephenate dehydratase [candidate division KSB1 bacterium]